MTSPSEPSFGVLTLATPRDYLKAIGLALSLRVSNPGVPIAVACATSVRPKVEPYFDLVIEEREGLRGFVHKVYLDEYSPFQSTVFFDSDVLVFKPIAPYLAIWGPRAYTACGKVQNDGKSTFGMDRQAVLRRLGKPNLTVIDGAGHAYFNKPECIAVFEHARYVTANHKSLIGDIPYADEDVLDYVMTDLDLEAMPFGDFFSRYLSAKPGTLKIDASAGVCSFVRADNGQVMSPCMMHFAADEAPWAYHRQLHRLFKRSGANAHGLWRQAAHDMQVQYVRAPVHELKKRLARLFTR